MDKPIIIHPIYHENAIYVTDAKPMIEPHHFMCAFESESTSIDFQTIDLKKMV